MFPNLILFNIQRFRGSLIDNSDYFNDYKDNYSYATDYIYSNKLHQSFYYRKKKLQKQQNQQHDTLNGKDKDNRFYKLNYLEISSSHIWFKNGFDELLKKFNQFKKLELRHVTFINPKNPLNEIHLDLSHLYLEVLKMGYIFCVPFNNIEVSDNITKLIINESETGRERVFEKNELRDSNQQQSILNLKCKFIDGLAYSFL